MWTSLVPLFRFAIDLIRSCETPAKKTTQW
jgi:hypothetical protein